MRTVVASSGMEVLKVNDDRKNGNNKRMLISSILSYLITRVNLDKAMLNQDSFRFTEFYRSLPLFGGWVSDD